MHSAMVNAHRFVDRGEIGAFIDRFVRHFETIAVACAVGLSAADAAT